MNTDNTAATSSRLVKVWAALRLRLQRYLSHLNASIDSQPLPRQHRMGAWERSGKDK
ncbi:MAG: hypothetical protein HYZ65_11645 [Burkholderiales bacterium]|nr:hypothetical protein [Burkholderiales bacterium]